MTRRDQHILDQPTLFGDSGVPGHRLARPSAVDHGKASRNENYDRIKADCPARCVEWLDRIKAAGPVCDDGSGGVTLDELSAATGLSPNKISGRITELKEAKLVRHTKYRRATRSGGTASVLEAVL